MALLLSKKFQAAVLAVIVMIAAELGLDLDPAALLAIVSPLIAFIFAQGIADVGKEAQKIKSDK